MDKTKFTPGPWKAFPNLIGTSYYINCAGNDGEITQYSPTVAETWGATYAPNKDPDNGMNDAHLIAAAPDMYNLLNKIALQMECFHGVDTDEIFDLLAKVRGE